MFVNAINQVAKFTYPLIISNHYQDGSTSSHLGSFVLLNEEGWIITAAHIIAETKRHQEHVQEYHNYIHGNGMVLNPKWILNHSLWFGADHHRIQTFHLLPENDFAIGKIEDYQAAPGQIYPKIISPSRIAAGRSLCKLGYPFYDIHATFTGNTFQYDASLFPIPHFPLDGMLTRIIEGDSNEWGKWIETSTPGLRGQSGGPLFDHEANLWGIQSMTRHLPLGFSPSINKGGVHVEENQFINLGWCIHPQVIIDFLEKFEVKYYRADDNS